MVKSALPLHSADSESAPPQRNRRRGPFRRDEVHFLPPAPILPALALSLSSGELYSGGALLPVTVPESSRRCHDHREPTVQQRRWHRLGSGRSLSRPR